MKIKSSKCSANNCVEVDMTSSPGIVYVYDEHGNRCTFYVEEWAPFVEGVKLGEFDINAS